MGCRRTGFYKGNSGGRGDTEVAGVGVAGEPAEPERPVPRRQVLDLILHSPF